ncbi:DNA polymerase Y family protein [Nisaea acidiphila]|uniref:DNA polymerase Y family protein n=1 Tax=Nisaea acidiphila TaxID=1862145 RepID=A0A9J7AV31_9PROT|nr:DNA polymerase Y family protein [Nisaea acidiphila]UUX50974.1 DNA polymerase Y family protein [Nisaea acidiphila]
MARRFLYLYIPDFAFEWRGREATGAAGTAAPDAPAVLTRRLVGTEVIAAVNGAAALQGIAVGRTLADARAMMPGLTVLEADPAADRKRLERLRAWCHRYTPMVALDDKAAPFTGEGGSAGLILDITGCAHLFRQDGAEDFATEEQALGRDCLAALERLGFAARLAVADAPDAARAVARFSAPMLTLVPEGKLRMALEPLPVAALGIAAATVEALDRVGLRRIAQLAGQPRAPLANRFGLALVEALDRALGELSAALDMRLPEAPFQERIAFAEPIALREDLEASARRTLGALCRRLEREQAGARRVRLRFFRVDGEVLQVSAGTSRACRDADTLFRLLAQHFDKIDPGFGIDMVLAEMLEGDRAAGVQAALGSTEMRDRDAVTDLGDRLANRLGADAVHRLQPVESHLPERAEKRAAGRPGRKGLTWTNIRPPAPERAARPVRLMRRPEPVEATALLPDHPPARFRWRGAEYRVAHAAGPERIAPEWWRAGNDDAEMLTRDYFRLEDGEGRRFWLYRDGLAERGEAPKWFLHGLFS